MGPTRIGGSGCPRSLERAYKLSAAAQKVRKWPHLLHEMQHNQDGTPITALTSRNSWKPNTPHSRPLPDFLYPPKAAFMS